MSIYLFIPLYRTSTAAGGAATATTVSTGVKVGIIALVTAGVLAAVLAPTLYYTIGGKIIGSVEKVNDVLVIYHTFCLYLL